MNRKDMLQALRHLEGGDWQRAHEIVHLMEGDRENARYWYRRAKRPFSEDVAAELAALSEALRA